jgi:hypothetical protein
MIAQLHICHQDAGANRPALPRRRRARRAAGRVARRVAGPALLVAGAALAAGCGAGAIREQFRPASPRDAYAGGLRSAGLDQTALGRDWAAAGERALAAPADAAVPLREQGAFVAGEATAAAWRLQPRRGQRVTLRSRPRPTRGRGSSTSCSCSPAATARARASCARATGSGRATRSTPTAGRPLRLPPPARAAARRALDRHDRGRAVARLPGAGPRTGAVQSFWGADRDGGARAHQGIDIFAPRGTPALAASRRRGALGGREPPRRQRGLPRRPRARALAVLRAPRPAGRDHRAARAGGRHGGVRRQHRERAGHGAAPALRHLPRGRGRGGPVSLRRPARGPAGGGGGARRRARRAAGARDGRPDRAPRRPSARAAAVADLPRTTLGTVDAAVDGALRLDFPTGGRATWPPGRSSRPTGPSGASGWPPAGPSAPARRPTRRRSPRATGARGRCTGASAPTGWSRSTAGRAGGGAGRRHRLATVWNAPAGRPLRRWSSALGARNNPRLAPVGRHARRIAAVRAHSVVPLLRIPWPASPPTSSSPYPPSCVRRSCRRPSATGSCTTPRAGYARERSTAGA